MTSGRPVHHTQTSGRIWAVILSVSCGSISHISTVNRAQMSSFGHRGAPVRRHAGRIATDVNLTKLSYMIFLMSASEYPRNSSSDTSAGKFSGPIIPRIWR
jgi:hypothetical protein